MTDRPAPWPRRGRGPLVAAFLVAAAAPGPWPSAGAAVDPARMEATRDGTTGAVAPTTLRDLAASYQRLERAAAREGWTAAARTRADRAMDEATAAFFRRRLAGAAAAIDAAVLAMHGAEDDPALRRLLAARPIDAVGGEPAVLRLRIPPDAATATIDARPDEGGGAAGAGPGAGAGPAAAPADRTLELLVLPDGPVRPGDLDPAGTAARATIDARRLIADGPDVRPGAADVIELPLSAAPSDGRWRIAVAGPFAGGAMPALELGHWTVSRTSFDADRRRLAARLEAIPVLDPSREAARWIVRDRLARLRDRLAPNDVTGFALDRVRLRSQLEVEVAALEAGEPPLADRPGDRWMRLAVDGGRWPVRVVAAPDVAAAAAAARAGTGDPPPLVLALHGAGGNEHLFVDGHAGGRLVRLAEREGFLLVAAPTTSLAVGGSLPALLDAIDEVQRFDPGRVLLVGHSLGAMTAGAQAGLHPDRVAAAALIAGGPTPRFEDPAAAPPLLYFGAARDTVVPAARVERNAALAESSGADVEYRLVPEIGHLLVVEEVLDEAVDWLLEQVEQAEQAEERGAPGSPPSPASGRAGHRPGP